ncbi:MAG: hypothetical protein COA50_12075 [Flavobacteriaceae bacterium]|nr:MAG: hypothetical protein COA50_12075 [Flavobacteriaceae bacterium]
MSPKLIVDQFALTESYGDVSPFGGGHINDTYLVENGSTGKHSYLLQKINQHAFKNVETLMGNITLVTSHIRKKMIANNSTDIDSKSLKVIPTKNRTTFFTDSDNQHWRMYNFINDSKVFDKVTDTNIAFEGARMFGSFLTTLSDLQPSLLQETIPDFHNIKRRLQQLQHQIKEDKADRVKYAKDAIRYVNSSYEIMSTIQKLGEKGHIPYRITHNDTKLNNVLFDKNNQGLCVVDLDTVMPGFVHYDFGDGIRTSANTGEEDDADLKNIGYDLEMFKAFSRGYISATHELLNEVELNSLAYASLLFPFIMGVRFLTDYLAGDAYYKTKYDDHNLIRAKAQFKLAQDGELKLEEMKRVIQRLTLNKG